MSKWIAEFDLEDGDIMPEHMDLNYMGAKIDFHCRPMWIPVSERLPTKKEYIANNGLFIVSDGNRTYAEYFDVYNSMKCFGEPTMNGFRVDRCVTAWMPLPEPWKGKTDGTR